MKNPKRYHPLHVTLHWLVATLVVLSLWIGKFVFPDSDYPEAAAALHMLAGISVLLLVVVRIFVRRNLPRPADATSGNRLLDFLAKFVHYGMYVMLLTITVLGVTFATLSGRLARTFFGAGPASGPPPDAILALRGLHGMAANILLLLAILHVGAAYYHQFILRDNLIVRMWWRKR